MSLYVLLYLFGEFTGLGVVKLAVDVTSVCLQLGELLAQQAQRQVRVHSPVAQVLVRLQPGRQVLNHSLEPREKLAGQSHLQENADENS